MSIIAKQDSGSHYPQIEASTYQAVCYGVIDLGTQYSEQYAKSMRKVLFIWELPDERLEVERDGKIVSLPRVISRQYTLSLHEKSKLYQDLNAWRGIAFTDEELAGFEVESVISANCMLTVVHNDKGKARVGGVSKLMKNLPKKKAESEKLYYSIEDHGYVIPEGVPEWIRGIIKESAEHKAVGNAAANPALTAAHETYVDDDPIPF